MNYSAIISDDKIYRLQLERELLPFRSIVASVLMVNPSTADGIDTDQTIRKLDGFGFRLGWSKYIVANKFAFRAKFIRDVGYSADPIGPNNDAYIYDAILRSDITVVAWGTLGKLPDNLQNRWRDIVEIASNMNRPLYCLEYCMDGQPKHPVMLGYNSQLKIWDPPT
jgi:hypothetical protein